MAKALHIPLDRNIRNLPNVPYTISFVIRKRQQIDSLNELSKDKRPPDDMIWNGTSEELDDWLDKIFNPQKGSNKVELLIDDIEE